MPNNDIRKWSNNAERVKQCSEVFWIQNVWLYLVFRTSWIPEFALWISCSLSKMWVPTVAYSKSNCKFDGVGWEKGSGEWGSAEQVVCQLVIKLWCHRVCIPEATLRSILWKVNPLLIKLVDISLVYKVAPLLTLSVGLWICPAALGQPRWDYTCAMYPRSQASPVFFCSSVCVQS